jgi:undecaprenyl phosphate-alpha-L-ara4FN deformylase
MSTRLALNVYIDTDRGTREGVPNLVADCREFGVPACFFFSFGPDQTGRAITRSIQPGIWKKIRRAGRVQTYGLRALLNGTLLPAPHIGRRNAHIMRAVRDAGFEVGIHSYNHHHWQTHLERMSQPEVAAEFSAACLQFRRIFSAEPHAAGAAGWQSNAHSRAAYEQADLLYSSDTRGTHPYFPFVGEQGFATLEIPTTLPALDELLGRPEFPSDLIVRHYLSLLRAEQLNVLALHAEIEGLGRRELFRQLLGECQAAGVEFIRLDDFARELLTNREAIPSHYQVMAEIKGRHGLVATQMV